jgi:hypothetical protein
MIVDRLTVEIKAGQGADAAEVARLASQLRRQLMDLDLEAVESPVTDPPPGTKAGHGTIVGVLLVTMAPTVLRATVEVIQAWLATAQARTVRVELDGDVLELSGASEEDQHTLVTSFVARHAERP